MGQSSTNKSGPVLSLVLTRVVLNLRVHDHHLEGLFKNSGFQDFPGNPVVKSMLPMQVLNPGWETKIPHACEVQPKKKKKFLNPTL